MARHRNVREADLAAAPARAAAANPALIECDFDRPQTAAVRLEAAAATVDTLPPNEDLFRARDELEARLGGFDAILAEASHSEANHETGKENILGLGVGFRISGGVMTGELAVKVYVREKIPESRLTDDSIIPSSIGGKDTDVEPIGEVLLHSYARRYPRPVPCGVSVSHIGLRGSGTLGCLVVLRNNRLCMLSNNHVLARENDARVGDHIIQPGNGERSPGADELVGYLENFVPIRSTNEVDAAVAWTSFARVSPAHVTYQLNPTPISAAFGMSVMKNGRTTQSTTGMVVDMGVTIRVPYAPFPSGAVMRNQIAIRGAFGSFSRPGDSGSLIVTLGSKQPVALLFAGASDNSMTFANPISAVMEALSIERFVGGTEGR